MCSACVHLQDVVTANFYAYVPAKHGAIHEVHFLLDACQDHESGKVHIPMTQVGNSVIWTTGPVEAPRHWLGNLVLHTNSGQKESVCFENDFRSWSSDTPVGHLCNFHPTAAKPNEQTPIPDKVISEGVFHYARSVLSLCNSDTLNTLLSVLVPFHTFSSTLCISRTDVKRWVESSVADKTTTLEQRLFLCMAWLIMAYCNEDGSIWSDLKLKDWCRRRLAQSIAPLQSELTSVVRKKLAYLVAGGGLRQPWLFHLDHWSLLREENHRIYEDDPNDDDIKDWMSGQCRMDVVTSDLDFFLNRLLRNRKSNLLLYLRFIQKLLASSRKILSRAVDEAVGNLRPPQFLKALGLNPDADAPYDASIVIDIVDLWQSASDPQLHERLLTAASQAHDDRIIIEMLNHPNKYLSANPGMVRKCSVESVTVDRKSLEKQLKRLSTLLSTQTLGSDQDSRKIVVRDVRSQLLDMPHGEAPYLLKQASSFATLQAELRTIFREVTVKALKDVTWNERKAQQCLQSLLDGHARAPEQLFSDDHE